MVVAARLKGKKSLVCLMVASLTLLMLGCEKKPQYKKVSLSGGTYSKRVHSHEGRELPLRVAVASVISPRESFKLYGPLLEYISRKLNRPVDFHQRRTHNEINDLLRSRHADVAFVCGYMYVAGKTNFGMQILVVPKVMGRVTYHSYIIVPKGSKAHSLKDLREKIFAFSDPLSISGWLFPMYILQLIGETPDTHFKRYVFTYSHDNTVKAVAEKLVDGGAVDSLVYEFMVARDRRYAEKIRVVQTSMPWGNPPVVVHPLLPRGLKAELKSVFLTMHQDDEGRKALKDLMIDKFVPPDQAAYKPVRAMAEKVEARR